MSDRERLRKIAELTVSIDGDVKWDIDNLTKEQVWIRGFIEGGAYVRDVYNQALQNAEPEDVNEIR